MDFAQIPTRRLEKMLAAGQEALNCQRVLNKVGENVVADVLRGCGTFYQMNHYPDGDVYDHDTHGQYYYHAHREGEHGHFHLFLRPKGMPEGIKPAQVADYQEPQAVNDALSHLIGISMNEFGTAKALFTTNRWVTAEYWYKYQDVIQMLDHFEIDHASPSWPANRWISAMVQLFHPQICDLLRIRDDVVADWQEQHPDDNVFECRDLDITSEIPCDVDEQIKRIEQELSKRA